MIISRWYIGVSLNGGTPKHPKMIILVGKPMVVGYHHLRKPPYIKCQQCNSHRLRAVERWDRNVVQRSVGLVPERIYVKLHILTDSGFGFTTKSQISKKKTNIKTTVHIIWKTHTGHKSLRFPTQNICRFGTLWCNRNHPSSKAWLSHPGATQDVWIFPKIPSSINLVYTQNNSTCQRINILLNQFPCNGCRMMLDACCKFIPALQQVAINILSSVKFMPGSCGHQLQLGLILMHSANGIRDIDIFDMWCVTDVYWQLISMILRCQRQT